MNNFPQTRSVNTKHLKAQEYKELCSKAGSVERGDSVGSWTVVHKSDPSKYKDGFKATTYQKGNKIVICYEGTNVKSVKDHGANLKMAIYGPSSQMESARKYYKDIEDEFGSNIDIAGHSEGGSEATYVGLINGKETYTYNAYRLGKKSLDVAKVKGVGKYDESLITNYRDPNDPISKMGRNVGDTYIVPSTQNPVMTHTPFGWLPAHRITNIGDCTEAIPVVEYKAKHPIFIDKIDEAHITIEDIHSMSNELFSFYEPEIDTRLVNRQITDDNGAHQMALKGELIYVRAYQRDDGTPVRGYYRRTA